MINVERPPTKMKWKLCWHLYIAQRLITIIYIRIQDMNCDQIKPILIWNKNVGSFYDTTFGPLYSNYYYFSTTYAQILIHCSSDELIVKNIFLLTFVKRPFTLLLSVDFSAQLVNRYSNYDDSTEKDLFPCARCKCQRRRNSRSATEHLQNITLSK